MPRSLDRHSGPSYCCKLRVHYVLLQTCGCEPWNDKTDCAPGGPSKSSAGNTLLLLLRTRGRAALLKQRGDFNANSSLSSALMGSKPFNGTNPDQFDDWHKRACFTLTEHRPSRCLSRTGGASQAQHHDTTGGSFTARIVSRATPKATVRQGQPGYIYTYMYVIL